MANDHESPNPVIEKSEESKTFIEKVKGNFETFYEWIKNSLGGYILAIVGFCFIPGEIVKAIFEIFEYPSSISNLAKIITIIVINIFVFAFCLPKHLRGRATFTTLILLILTGISLIGAFVIQMSKAYEKDETIKKLNETLNSELENINDPLIAWSSKISTEAVKCETDPNQKNIPDSQCVANVIRANPLNSGNDASEKLVNEVRAGKLLMNDPLIKEVFSSKLGLEDNSKEKLTGKSKFLGTGLTLPQGTTNYSEARLPEFLAPNVHDNIEEVFTWQLNPKGDYKDFPVKCFIVKCEGNNITDPPTNSTLSLPTNKVGSQNTETNNANDNYTKSRQAALINIAKNCHSKDHPILIRLEQFNKAGYSNQLALSYRTRAFMVRLEDVWDKPLGDALVSSGHRLKDPNEADTIFMWIYMPSSPDDIVQATWGNILAHPEWLK